jgi:hypothetical protein
MSYRGNNIFALHTSEVIEERRTEAFESQVSQPASQAICKLTQIIPTTPKNANSVPIL